MRFDFRELPMATRYKVLTSTVTPRPIAWITTRSAAGVVNAAPYSFFNAVGIEPPMVVLGLLKDLKTYALKDTATNIAATGEFVVNLVGEDDAERMNQSSAEVPRGVSEVDYAGIATIASDAVAPPRIATSPVSFECRRIAALDIGTAQTVVLGEILVAHVADAFVSDPKRAYLDTPAMKLIGRTHGSGWYVRNGDSFQVDRHAYDPARLASGDGSGD